MSGMGIKSRSIGGAGSASSLSTHFDMAEKTDSSPTRAFSFVVNLVALGLAFCSLLSAPGLYQQTGHVIDSSLFDYMSITAELVWIHGHFERYNQMCNNLQLLQALRANASHSIFHSRVTTEESCIRFFVCCSTAPLLGIILPALFLSKA